jgi:hypothetical protein
MSASRPLSSNSDQIANITPRRRKLAIREFAIGRLGLGVRFNLGATEGCDVCRNDKQETLPPSLAPYGSL